MELKSKKESDLKKFLSAVNSSTGRIVCGFLLIIAGIWIPAGLFGLRSWTAIPSIITGIFTVALGVLIVVKGAIELKWINRY